MTQGAVVEEQGRIESGDAAVKVIPPDIGAVTTREMNPQQKAAAKRREKNRLPFGFQPTDE